jgi:hypothetical protein
MDKQAHFLNLKMNVNANKQPHCPPYIYSLQSSTDKVNILTPVQYFLSMQV